MRTKNDIAVRYSKLSILTLLAIVFTVALTFATLEFPLVLNDMLHGLLDKYFYDWEHVLEFFGSLRVIGYACIAAVIGLTIIGFKTGKGRLSSLGSIAFFLPTFGYFAASMFVLSGIGFLRVLWTPFFEWYEAGLKLGDIVFLPYLLVSYPFKLIGLDARAPLALLTMGVGLFIFCFGTLTWFYGKSEKREIVDFWIYKYSRHPQYLGFLIWSYGVLLFGTLSPDILPGDYLPEPSFPWLISSLLLICVALTEEIKMSKTANESYLAYQRSTPFLIPLPQLLSKAIMAPYRLLLKKDRPTTGKQVLYAFAIYIVIFILLSLAFQVLVPNWRHPIEPGPVIVR